MPKYVIERQYLLPVYHHDVIDAPDFETACRRSIENDNWDLATEDYDCARPTHLTEAVEVPEGWQAPHGGPLDGGGPASAALYDSDLPKLEIPDEFTVDWSGVPAPAATPALTDREHATVLAALRFWQAHRPQLPKTDITGAPLVGARDAMILDIADDAGTVEPLLDDEIDALCERLNAVDREAE